MKPYVCIIQREDWNEIYKILLKEIKNAKKYIINPDFYYACSRKDKPILRHSLRVFNTRLLKSFNLEDIDENKKTTSITLLRIIQEEKIKNKIRHFNNFILRGRTTSKNDYYYIDISFNTEETKKLIKEELAKDV